MKTIIALCVLLLAATAHAQQFDLLGKPATQVGPSAFDLLHVDAQASSPAASTAEFGFDLLFVATPQPADVIANACQCGCGKARCDCKLQIANCKLQIAKPVVSMRSASWCSVCDRAKKEIAAATDCPFRLDVIADDNSTDPLPIFEWRVAGKLWTTSDPKTGKARPGYAGYTDLLANWEATQSVTDSASRRASAPGRPGANASGSPTHEAAIADSVQRHFVARVQSPPAGLSKPADSPKKSNGNSSAGSKTNAADSGVKSPPPSSPNTAKPSASTPSPGL